MGIPGNIRIHPVIHVEHSTPFIEAEVDLGPHLPSEPPPVITEEIEEYVVSEIFSHRKKGKGYEFLTLLKGTPRHEAEWQPTCDFMDEEGTLTEAFHVYITQYGILSHLQ